MAVWRAVNVAELRALLPAAAAVAVLEARGFPIVGVIGGDVAAVTAAVRLHAARALHRATITAQALVRASTTCTWARIIAIRRNKYYQ